MLEDLLLLSGNDIPFPAAKVSIHQPTLKEIAYIGEEAFFVGCGFLDFSKKFLTERDKIKLSDCDDFDIFMSIMINRKEEATRQTIDSTLLVLSLIFPLYEILVRKDCLILKREQEECYINKKNFSQFKSILKQMFSLDLGKEEENEYNPSGDLSKRIANKFKERHEKLIKLKNDIKTDSKKISILSRYVSILSIGNQQSINDLMQYTVYQLYDEFQRFQMKMQWDTYIQAKMAGAQDLEEVDNWMIDFRPQGKNKK